MATGPQRDRGSYRHMLDLACSSSFATIVNRLLNGTGAQLADPCCQHPKGRGSRVEWTETDVEKYLRTQRHQSGIVVDPEWWFPYKTNLNRRPMWDMFCHLLVKGKPGLLLVEAKAHLGELSELDHKSPPDPKSARARANDYCVRLRLCEASLGLTDLGIGRFRLSADSHYQLSNRLAYLWKLASDGVPVILLYLGWLKSPDWPKDPFRDARHWEQIVVDHMKTVAPKEFIGRTFPTNSGGTMQMIVRSLDAKEVSMMSRRP